MKELSYGNEGVWTRFVVGSTEKKKRDRRPIVPRPLADKSKSPIKCRKSLRDLEQVHAKKAGGACMGLQSIHRKHQLAFEGQVER